MATIHPKFSHADMAGLAGLLAFLADPEACKARLEELQAEADAAYKAQSVAQAKINEELELQKTGQEQMAVVNSGRKLLAEKIEEFEKAVAALNARESEVAARERAVGAGEESLAFRAEALKKGESELTAARAALEADKNALAEAQAEHAKKLERLRALAG